MVDQIDVERAARRRVLAARLMGLLLLLTQLQDIALRHGYPTLAGIRPAIGLLWAGMILLFVLVAGGGLARNPATRAALYDESTIDHGRRALVLGFWIALVTCAAYWIGSLDTFIGGVEVAKGVVSCSIALALLRFATLEMWALKDA